MRTLLDAGYLEVGLCGNPLIRLKINYFSHQIVVAKIARLDQLNLAIVHEYDLKNLQHSISSKRSV